MSSELERIGDALQRVKQVVRQNSAILKKFLWKFLVGLGFVCRDSCLHVAEPFYYGPHFADLPFIKQD